MADPGQAAGSTSARSLIHVLGAVKQGFFSTVHSMSKSSRSNHGVTYLAAFITWLQLLSFVVQYEHTEWDPVTIQVARLAELSSSIGWIRRIDQDFSYLVLFFIAFAIVAIYVGLLAWAVRAFTRGDIASMWPIHLLAKIGNFASGVAFIPAFYLLLTVFQCQDDEVPYWIGAGFNCNSGAHLAIEIVSCILAVSFLAVSCMIALTYYESHNLSSNLAAKSHGRVEFVVLVLKSICVLIIGVVHDYVGPSKAWAVVGTNLGAAIVWIAAFYIFMPYTHHSMNRIYTAIGTSYLYAGICLAVQTATTTWGAAPAAFIYIGMPTSFLAGIYLADYRQQMIVSVPVSKMSTPFEVDLKARYMLQGAVDATLAAYAHAAETNPSASGDSEGDNGNSNGANKSPSGGDGSRSARSGHHHHQNSKEGNSPDAGLLVAAFKAMDSEQRADLVRSKLPKNVIEEADALYRAAVIRFPTSSILHVFQARFYHVYRDDKHLHMSHLLQVIRLEPSFDVDYLAFTARRSAEADAAGAGNASTGMARVAFEKHLNDARLCTLQAAQAQVQFWSELSDQKPDIARLAELATKLHKYQQDAEIHFHELFQLNPQSLSALRLFAQYNVCVVNNSEKASAISAEADRIEDQKNKDNQGNTGNTVSGAHQFKTELPVEVMSDATAAISVGASSRDLGMILTCNAAACKLFGYTRLQLERRNVAILIPSPYAEAHDAIMRRYISTGEGKLLETVRVMLAQHRNGSLFPLLILIRPSHTVDGQQSFTAVMRTITTAEQFVVMDQNWRIRGASTGALMAFGLEPATLSSSEVYIQDYIPQLDDDPINQAMRNKPLGEIVRVRAPGNSAGPNDASSSSYKAPSSVRRGGGGSTKSDENSDKDTASEADSSDNLDVSESDDGYMYVRASLNTSSSRFVTIHLMSWRLLTPQEQAQIAAANRTGSSTPSTPVPGAAGSFRAEKRPNSFNNPSTTSSAGRRSSTSGLKLSINAKNANSKSPRKEIVDDKEDTTSPGVRFHDEHTVIQLQHHHEADGAAGHATPTPGATTTTTKRQSSSNSLLANIDEGDIPDSPLHHNDLDSEVPHGHPMLNGGSLGASLTQCPVMRAPSANGSNPHLHRSANSNSGNLRGAINERGSVTGHESIDGGSHKQQFTQQPAAIIRRAPTNNNDDAEDDRKSEGQSSHGSSSKMSMGRGTFAKLRRALANVKDNKQRSAGLSRLWLVGYGLILVNVVLATVAAVVLDHSFASYSVNLRFAELASLSTATLFRAVRHVHQLTLFSRGLFPSTADEEQANQVDLAYQADMFAQYQHEMFDLAQGSIVEDEFTSRTVSQVSFDDSIILAPNSLNATEMHAILEGDEFHFYTDGGYIYEGRKLYTSATDYVYLLSGMMKQWSNFPPAAITFNHPLGRTIVENSRSGASLSEKVIESIMSAYLVSVDTKESVQNIAFYIFISMGPALLALLIIFVTPILLSLERSRDDVIERFLDVPALVVATLRTQAERRLKGLRIDDDDEAAADDDDDLDGNGNNDANYMDDDDDEAGFDWDSLFQRAAIEHSRAEKRALKREQRQLGGSSKTSQAKQSRRSSSAMPGSKPQSSSFANGSSNNNDASKALMALTSENSSSSTVGDLIASPDPFASSLGGFASQQQQYQSANGAVALQMGRRGSSNPFASDGDDDLGSSATGLSTSITVAPVAALSSSLVNDRTNSNGNSKNQPLVEKPQPVSPVLKRGLNANIISNRYQLTESPWKPSVLMMSLGCSTQRFRSIYNPDGSVSHQRRQFRKGGRSMLKLCAFQLPVLCIFAFYLALYMVTLDTLSTVITLSSYTTLANTRTATMLASSSSVFMYMTNQGYDVELTRMEHECTVAVANFRNLHAQLAFAQAEPDAAPFLDMGTPPDLAIPDVPAGSESTTIPGVDAVTMASINKVMFGDACPIINSINPAVSVERCRTLADGVFSSGLHAGLTAYMNDIATMRQRRSNAHLPYNSTAGVGVMTTIAGGVQVQEAYGILSELNSTRFKRVDDLRLNVFNPVLKKIGGHYSDAGALCVSDYRAFLVVYVAAFVSVFSIGMLLVYLPAIRIVGADLHAKRCLLMVLPPAVVAKVPSLRNMVLDIVSESDGGGQRKASQQVEHADNAAANNAGGNDRDNEPETPMPGRSADGGMDGPGGLQARQVAAGGNRSGGLYAEP